MKTTAQLLAELLASGKFPAKFNTSAYMTMSRMRPPIKMPKQVKDDKGRVWTQVNPRYMIYHLSGKDKCPIFLIDKY